MRAPPLIQALPLALLACIALPLQSVQSATPCEDLARLELPNVISIAAQAVPAGPLSLQSPAMVAPKGEVPAFCRVTLIVRPQITIEVWLPKENWNKRFRGEGGGGYVGYIIHSSMANALRAGYATASTDTGHHHSVEGAFGLNRDGSLNSALIEDFAWRSLQELAVKAKAVIQAHYGEPPRYSYFRGASTGGRQGLAAVQRFPEEYDGVLSGCPAINWDNYLLSTVLWQNFIVWHDVGHAIADDQLAAVNKAVIAACDARDGVTDGLINDPRQCRFDPGSLICKGRKAEKACLTQQEAGAIRKIWSGPTRTGTTDRLWFGLEPGTPLWWASKNYADDGKFEHLNWTKQDPAFDWRTLKEADFEALIRESSRKFKHVIATDQADLQAFRARGGKLMIWHGEYDEIIPPRGIIHYFNRVLAANGGSAAVDSFARLFLAPGFGHGSGDAPFPRTVEGVDPLFDALVNWVEKGIAPDRIEASQNLPNGAVRTRPLCPYPRVARWTRKGSTDEAANFECVQGQYDPEDFRVVQWP